MEGFCVVPGDLIGNTSEYKSGPGSFTRGDQIRASLTGFVSLTSDDGQTPMVQVLRGNQKPTIVPKLGDVVVCKVL